MVGGFRTWGWARSGAGGRGAASCAAADGDWVLSADCAGADDCAGTSADAVLGHPLAFSFGGLLVGSMLYSLPFAVQPLVAGFQAVDRGFIEAAAGLGAPPAKVFVSVVLPMARASLLTSAILAFTHTVGEFGVVLMLGGNIPGATRTLSISLYDLVQDGNYAAANRTALVLVAFAIVALMVIYLLPSVRKTDGRQADIVR